MFDKGKFRLLSGISLRQSGGGHGTVCGAWTGGVWEAGSERDGVRQCPTWIVGYRLRMTRQSPDCSAFRAPASWKHGSTGAVDCPCPPPSAGSLPRGSSMTIPMRKVALGAVAATALGTLLYA